MSVLVIPAITFKFSINVHAGRQLVMLSTDQQHMWSLPLLYDSCPNMLRTQVKPETDRC